MRSFSQAATAHGVSQPNASQLVHQLEERLGVRLIDRSKRPFVTTDAGQRYYEGCRALLRKFQELEGEVQSVHRRLADRLVVASIYSVGLAHMSRYHREFLDRHPETELRLDYMHPNEVYDAVEAEEADLGLVSYPEKSRQLATIPWRTEPFVLVCAPYHELAANRRAPLESLRGQRFVAFEQGLKIREEIDHAFEVRHIEVDTVFEFDNVETIKRAVEIGSGVALLPAPTVAREVLGGSLVAIDLSGQQLARPIGLVYKAERELSEVATKFIELLQSHAGESHDDLAPAAVAATAANNKTIHN